MILLLPCERVSVHINSAPGRKCTRGEDLFQGVTGMFCAIDVLGCTSLYYGLKMFALSKKRHSLKIVESFILFLSLSISAFSYDPDGNVHCH